MKPSISNFVVDKPVTQAFADQIIDPSRLSCFQVSSVQSATHGDLSKHRHMKYLEFDDRFNSPLQIGCFSDQLKHITFGADFNQSIGGILPAGLRLLWLGKSFNQPISPSSLPSSIVFMFVSESFNQLLRVGALPSSLLTLVLCTELNISLLPGVLPSSLTHLTYHGVADQPLLPGSLPASLKRLELCVLFDQPIHHGVLPHGLTHLILSSSFNHPLTANIIPNTVTHLTFGRFFNQVLLPGVIPSSVLQLQFGQDYQQPLLPNSLPNSIKHLIFFCNATECLEGNVLPNSIEHLEVGHFEKFLLPEDDESEPLILLPDMFPASVTQLTIHRKWEVGTVLPSTITKLVFGPRFSEQIPVDFIPSSVTNFTFGRDYTQLLTPDMLPSSVKYLTSGKHFEPRMLTPFPSHVTHVCFEKSLTNAEAIHITAIVPKSTKYTLVNVVRGPLPSGLIVKMYMCMSYESGTAKVYTSKNPFDIENPNTANLRGRDHHRGVL